MKTPLGTDVDLGPGHIVLDGVPAPRKGHSTPPLFSAHIYCGHGRPSQLLVSSCIFFCTPDTGCQAKEKGGVELNNVKQVMGKGPL